MFGPSLSSSDTSRAIARLSPVTMRTCSPIFRAVAMVEAESSRGGSDKDSSPRNSHFPCASVRATPRVRKPLAASSLTCFSAFLRASASGMDQIQNHLWGALRDFESDVVVFDLGLGSLADRIEGGEMSDLIGL